MEKTINCSIGSQTKNQYSCRVPRIVRVSSCRPAAPFGPRHGVSFLRFRLFLSAATMNLLPASLASPGGGTFWTPFSQAKSVHGDLHAPPTRSSHWGAWKHPWNWAAGSCHNGLDQLPWAPPRGLAMMTGRSVGASMSMPPAPRSPPLQERQLQPKPPKQHAQHREHAEKSCIRLGLTTLCSRLNALGPPVSAPSSRVAPHPSGPFFLFCTADSDQQGATWEQA